MKRNHLYSLLLIYYDTVGKIINFTGSNLCKTMNNNNASKENHDI